MAQARRLGRRERQGHNVKQGQSGGSAMARPISHPENGKMSNSHGTDARGRPYGHGIIATCDAAGCRTKIDRGTANACGGDPGGGLLGCGRYFCEPHRRTRVDANDYTTQVCEHCRDRMLSTGEFVDEPMENRIVFVGLVR